MSSNNVFKFHRAHERGRRCQRMIRNCSSESNTFVGSCQESDNRRVCRNVNTGRSVCQDRVVGQSILTANKQLNL